ncbi:MAG: Uma2 family endonuclease [Pseudanabaenaceae cyanobacterium bins.68]|nr:Uma2 family endonuclease [Pseudanabaenaceae cyanobacterium bins.68]
MIAATQNHLTPAQYLAWEEHQIEKHEYVAGEIYAMAGASENHVILADNFSAILVNKLRGSKCRSFSSDMRVYIPHLSIYYYPDLLVTCDQRDRINSNAKNYPCLIIEVLSESTEARDRGSKFAHYQTIETLDEYVLISQSELRVEIFRRHGKFWLLETYTTGDQVHLQTIDLTIAIADIYAEVSLK